ncbi:YbaB/EbfC family nucleoid-associated protein [Actinoallomurus sp. CA-150999]|uniref:YbaB/EbfC family nucleoid-associated protein n=1 Tax=Actinoallomurus sp. CA-150999 TaxID=3239887 RepID=UPI003D8DA897
MDEPRRKAAHEAELASKKADLVQSKLTAKHFEVRDQAKGVVVIATGDGRIVSIEISEQALMYPEALSNAVTSAVNRARSKAKVISEKYWSTVFPDWPTDREIEALLPTGETAAMDAVDYSGSTEVRNSIAAGMERLAVIREIKERLRIRAISQPIGRDLGTVQLNLSDTVTKISISGGVSGTTSATQLSAQIVLALRDAQVRADSERRRVFQGISDAVINRDNE